MTGRNEIHKADEEFLDIDPHGAGSSTGENSDANSTTRAIRGFSRNIELDRYVHVHGRILMEVNPELMKPVGPHATRFSLAIGTVVRESFPVRCATIVDVPKQVRDLAKAELLRYFQFDLSKQEVDTFLERQFQTIFKEYRAELHKHYKKYASPEEARAHPHDRLKNAIEDWHAVCSRFEDPEWKKKSEKNKRSRAALKFNHKAGSKSFLSIQHEAKEKEGRDVGPIDLFEMTHAKNGRWVNQAAEDAHTQMVQLSETSTDQEGSEQLSSAVICETVLGRRPGHIKGIGWGPKPPKSNKGCNSSSSASASQREVEQALEINTLKAQLAQTNEKLSLVEERMEATKEETRAEVTSIRSEMQEMMKKFFESQGGPSK